MSITASNAGNGATIGTHQGFTPKNGISHPRSSDVGCIKSK